MDRSWWRVLTKCGPLEKAMANHFSIPAGIQMTIISTTVGKNHLEEMDPKQKQHPVVDVTGDRSKVR